LYHTIHMICMVWHLFMLQLHLMMHVCNQTQRTSSCCMCSLLLQPSYAVQQVHVRHYSAPFKQQRGQQSDVQIRQTTATNYTLLVCLTRLPGREQTHPQCCQYKQHEKQMSNMRSKRVTCQKYHTCGKIMLLLGTCFVKNNVTAVKHIHSHFDRMLIREIEKMKLITCQKNLPNKRLNLLFIPAVPKVTSCAEYKFDQPLHFLLKPKI